MSEKIIDVAVGLLIRPDGKLLLGQRPEGKPWSGWWELPGGKLEPGETVQQALSRELHEELGIQVTQAYPWVTYVHAYPQTTVRLAFCHVTGWEGKPQGLENQQLEWVEPTQASRVGELLPATLPPLRWLQLPTSYGISSIGSPAGLEGFLLRLDHALAKGLKLVQFREPEWPEGPNAVSLQAALQEVLNRCHATGARVLVNSVHPESWWSQADGVHLRAIDTKQHSTRPDIPPNALVGVSTHCHADVVQARHLNADFAVLGPVLATPTHPEHKGLGWQGFTEGIQDAGLPVFALGGQSEATREQARQHGAHGIAGIRALI